MAKKQTRRSISVSRMTYERLKAFCEANNVSMSQLVETRVNDFLAGEPVPTVIPQRVHPAPAAPVRPSSPSLAATLPATSSSTQIKPTAPSEQRPAVVPMTSAAARFAVEPPPPIIKQKQQESAPKPTEKRPDQIFTF
jgi:hypothetical protein